MDIESEASWGTHIAFLVYVSSFDCLEVAQQKSIVNKSFGFCNNQIIVVRLMLMIEFYRPEASIG
jgi:hypothetical protein